MKPLEKNPEFLELYYKCYSNIKIFTVAAISAAEDKDFRVEDALNRAESARRREEYAAAKEKHFSANTESADALRNESDILQEHSRRAIAILSDNRSEKWHESIQEILSSHSVANSPMSEEETRFMKRQFPNGEELTVEGLLQTIKSSLIEMIDCAILGTKDRDADVSISYKRWLRWNLEQLKKEIKFLFFVDGHFGLEPNLDLVDTIDKLKNATEITLLGYSDVQQIMRQVERRRILSSGNIELEGKDKDKFIFKSATERLRSFIDNLVRTESFPWFINQAEGRKLKTWVDSILADNSVVTQLCDPYCSSRWETDNDDLSWAELNQCVKYLKKSWKDFNEALEDDALLKVKYNEIFKEKCQRRSANELNTRFQNVAQWFKEQGDEASESAFMRFFTNLWRGLEAIVYNPIETAKAIGHWMNNNRLKTGLIIFGGIGTIALCIFAPYLAPILVGAGYTLTTAIAAAGALTVGASGMLIAYSAAVTSGAGGLIRYQDNEEIKALEREAEKAERLAVAAEARAEKARSHSHRTKGDKYTSDADKDSAERAELIARIEAIDLRARANAAKGALEKARANQLSRPTEQSSSQEVAIYNARIREDSATSAALACYDQVFRSDREIIQAEGEMTPIFGRIAVRIASIPLSETVLARPPLEARIRDSFTYSEHSALTLFPSNTRRSAASNEQPKDSKQTHDDKQSKDSNRDNTSCVLS